MYVYEPCDSTPERVSFGNTSEHMVYTKTERYKMKNPPNYSLRCGEMFMRCAVDAASSCSFAVENRPNLRCTRLYIEREKPSSARNSHKPQNWTLSHGTDKNLRVVGCDSRDVRPLRPCVHFFASR